MSTPKNSLSPGFVGVINFLGGILFTFVEIHLLSKWSKLPFEQSGYEKFFSLEIIAILIPIVTLFLIIYSIYLHNFILAENAKTKKDIAYNQKSEDEISYFLFHLPRINSFVCAISFLFANLIIVGLYVLNGYYIYTTLSTLLLAVIFSIGYAIISYFWGLYLKTNIIEKYDVESLSRAIENYSSFGIDFKMGAAISIVCIGAIGCWALYTYRYILNIIPETAIKQGNLPVVVNIVFFALILSSVSFLFIFFIARTSTRPLRNLAYVIANTTISNPPDQMRYHTSDEVGRLIVEFNKLLKRLKQTIDQNIYLSKLSENSVQNKRSKIIIENLDELITICRSQAYGKNYQDDLVNSLKEIKICYQNQCFISVLSLSGKVLEICLKQTMKNKNISFDDNWMIGTLIKKIKEYSPEQYLDQSLGQISNIINQSRIPAVHSKEKIPVPSQDQAVMVIYAVSDLIKRVMH